MGWVVTTPLLKGAVMDREEKTRQLIDRVTDHLDGNHIDVVIPALTYALANACVACGVPFEHVINRLIKGIGIVYESYAVDPDETMH